MTKKIFIKTTTADERKKVLAALVSMGYAEKEDWHRGDADVEYHAGYFSETSVTSNCYYGWAEQPETQQAHPATEYVLGFDDKLYPKGQEPAAEVIDASVTPDSVKSAVREALAYNLRQASSKLDAGDDPTVEHWKAIFELQEFLSKP